MTEQVNLKLGEDYKERLEKIAEQENRNMTQQVRAWIDRFKPRGDKE